MRPYTCAQMQDVAEACRGFLDAHERRAADCVSATLNEEQAAHKLRWTLAVREREDLEAAMGTAA